MAALPRQVEQDLADLEAYEKQLHAEQNPQEAQPDDQKPADPDAAKPDAKPDDQPKPTAVPDPKPVATDWEQKYRTLQGMYDAETPRLHAENKALKQQMATMQEQITALANPPAKPPVEDPLITQQDETEYGKELLDVMDRVSRKVVREQVAPLQQELAKRDKEIADLKAAQTNTTGDVATLTFEQRLNQTIPDFGQINVDPKWIAWLDEIDPYTSEPRRNFATFVYSQGDVAKLKTIVDFYKKSTGVDTANAERQQRQTELERQVTPTRANTQQSTVPTTNTRIYTEAQMDAEWDQVRRLNTAHKYEDAAKLEAELSLAYTENRVRG